MQQRKLFITTLLITLLNITACGNKSPSTNQRLSLGYIINGSEVANNSSTQSSIVGIYNAKKGSICTGSLIASNIVLTAAHCVSKKPQDLKIIFSINLDDAINTREPDTYEEQVKPVVAIQVAAGWDPKDHTKEDDTSDIAILKFKGELPSHFKPAKFLANPELLKKDQMVVLAGYGVSKVDLKTIDPKTYSKIDQAIEYGDVVCSEARSQNYGTCFEVATSGDGLLRMTRAPIASLTKTEVRLDETKAGTCNGDSGGPAYIEIEGELLLFGITSRGSELCNEIGVYTNALYYLPWITNTIKTM